jgi:V/A-type H+-transporting ATPase subunit I
MKKVYLVTQKKDAAAALIRLREIGVLHLQAEQAPLGGDIDQLEQRIRIVQNTLGILPSDAASGQNLDLDDWQSKAEEILGFEDMILRLKENIASRQSQIDFWQAWGNFEPQEIKNLALQGVDIHLCEIAAKEFKTVAPEIVLMVLQKTNAFVRCVVSGPAEKLHFPSIKLPDKSLQLMRQLQIEDKALLHKTQKQLQAQGRYRLAFERILKTLQEQLNFEEALGGMGKSGPVVFVKGFCPVDRCCRLEAAAPKESWVVLTTEPDPGDRVPTLLKNSRFVEFIKPVFQFMSILPGYREADVSLCFLAFFSVFFGMLIGDAGYGAVFMLATVFFHRKMKNSLNPAFALASLLRGQAKAAQRAACLDTVETCGVNLVPAGQPKANFAFPFLCATDRRAIGGNAKFGLKDFTPIYLTYLLSACAILWGILTGTVFGVSLFGHIFKPAFPWLTEEKNVQLLCFSLGAIHLTIAHIWRLLRKLPSLLAVADVGWIVMVWAAFFYAKKFILSAPLPDIVNPAVFVSFGVIVLFSQSFEDIRKDVGGFVISALLTVLAVVSTLIDVISYIRLYAVGIAGLALSEAFNQMALAVGFHNLFLGIGSVLILVAGHALNIVLGMMAVMVHGLRLNILEFSGHLSLEWTGVEYNPFRKFE